LIGFRQMLSCYFPSFQFSKFVIGFVLTALLFPLGASRAQQDQDDDVIRTNTDLVVLNAAVFDTSGKYVHGLKRKDFTILEDGKEQKISGFSAEETPFAAAVLIDMSGSMESRVTLARSAAIRFLDGLRQDDVATVYKFDSKVQQMQEFSPSRDLSPLMYDARAKGMTVLYDAIVQASEDLAKRPELRRAIVVISDGADTMSKASSTKAIAAALRANAVVYSVDMADQFAARNTQTIGASGILKDFAVKSGGRYLDSLGGQRLRQSFEQIIEELSNQYTISYQSTNKARDGKFRSIQLGVARTAVTARTRKGYNAPKN
jgi:Ca-activated chloride channel family protein